MYWRNPFEKPFPDDELEKHSGPLLANICDLPKFQITRIPFRHHRPKVATINDNIAKTLPKKKKKIKWSSNIYLRLKYFFPFRPRSGPPGQKGTKNTNYRQRRIISFSH